MTEPGPTPRALPVTAPPPVLLYDGVCGLCARTVQFVLRHDRSGLVRFLPLQSRQAAAVMARHGHDAAALRSLAFITDLEAPGERVQVRSDGVLALASAMGGPFRALALFRWVPRFLRDAAYELVARSRYRIFGKSDTCMLPAPEHRARFLSED